MRFDELNLPIEDNASDKQDSARLAGFLTVVEWPIKIELQKYLKSIPNGSNVYSFKYVRHPYEYIYDLSRDQYVCLIAGYKKLGFENCYVSREFVNGKDYMSPTIAGHEQRCKGLKASLWQDAWFAADIIAYAIECLWNRDEPNQLLCMVDIAGPKWTKFFCAITPWKKALTKYWITTRARPEVELVEHTIKYFEGKINAR